MANSATPFPLGAYLDAPDGSSATSGSAFFNNYNSFTSLMGTAPAYLDYYTASTQPVSDWVSAASWQAWAAAQSSDSANATPVFGLSMSSTAPGALSADQEWKAIASGNDDGVLTGIVNAWVGQGFKNLVVRPGSEMNLPGANYAGDSVQDQSDWVAAFQHIYTVLHQTAAAAGANMTVVWNPSTTNYTNANATANLYPGNNYVDVIGADTYSDLFPYSNNAGTSTYQDWATGGTDSSVAQFFANPINREHYWSYPAATVFSSDSSTGHSLSLDNLIQFAEQQGKPFAIPETGAGSANSSTDVSDDAAYPQWLASQLTTAEAAGLKVSFVNLWDSNAGSNYEFSNASDNKPQEAAAWAQYFGTQSGLTPTTSVTPAVSSTSTSSAATPSTSSSATTSAASSDDTVVLTGSSGSITDGSGNTWAVTNGGQVTVNGTTDTSTVGVTELAYVDGTVWQENSNNLWWGKTQPSGSWTALSGSSDSPLPEQVTIGPNSGTGTVSQSQVSVIATAGTQMLFLNGSGDIVKLSGADDTISDTGSGNTYVLPAAGNGSDTFTSDILSSGNTLDLQTALAATDWDGATSTLSNYLSVSNTSQGATLSISATSGGTDVKIATIAGETGASLSSVLAHSIT